MNHLIVRHGKNVVLAEGVHEGERELVVLIFSRDRVGLDVVVHIVSPAHVPLEVESQSAFVNGFCYHRPRGRLLRYHEYIRELGEYLGVELFEERYRFKVVVSTVGIRYPLSRISVVVEVEH